MKPIRISMVNYLNAVPFAEGIRRFGPAGTHLMLDHPSDSAARLRNEEADIALAPVALLADLSDARIIGGYCIGSDGPVRTVQLFSEVPLNEIRRIYLDYQSRTSVQLVRQLCLHHWKIEPEFVPAYPGFQKDIYGNRAGVIIGDRAVRVLGRYRYEFDLSEAWKDWTGRPFVFAAWITRLREIDPGWVKAFDHSLAGGLALRPELAQRYHHLDSAHFGVEEYLNRYIRYELDEARRDALDVFLQMLKAAD